MRIMGDSISLTGLTALYATRGVKPAPGFDAGYISVSDVAIALRDFYNESSTVRLPIARLQARERCGLRIASGSGTVGIDSLGLTLDNLNITTGYSAIKATADVPFALMALKPQAPVNATLSGHIGIPDVEAFMPSLKQFTSLVPARKPLNLDLKAKGTLSALNVGNLLVAMPGVVKLQAKGAARNPLDVNRLSARLAFDGELADPRLADKFLSSSGIEVPAFTIKGNAEVNGREYGADFDLRTTAGDVVGRGRVALNPETYTADIRAEGLDVGRFMPSLGIGKVSAAVKASGAGFNPMSGHARTDAVVDISSIEYNRRLLRDIHADVKLGGDGNFSLLASSPNPDIDFDIEFARRQPPGARPDRLRLRRQRLHRGPRHGQSGPVALQRRPRHKQPRLEPTFRLYPPARRRQRLVARRQLQHRPDCKLAHDIARLHEPERHGAAYKELHRRLRPGDEAA